MAYSVGVERRAQKQLSRLAPVMRDRVENTLRAMAGDPRPRGSKPLQGRPGYRVRVGDYRIVYEVDDDRQTVIVLQIGHRRDGYRHG